VRFAYPGYNGNLNNNERVRSPGKRQRTRGHFIETSRETPRMRFAYPGYNGSININGNITAGLQRQQQRQHQRNNAGCASYHSRARIRWKSRCPLFTATAQLSTPHFAYRFPVRCLPCRRSRALTS